MIPQLELTGNIVLTPEELKRAIADTQVPIRFQARALPEILDYRRFNGFNMVQTVMDQGNCQSCWVLCSIVVLSSFIAKNEGRAVIPIQPEPFMTYLSRFKGKTKSQGFFACGSNPVCERCPPCSSGTMINFMHQIFSESATPRMAQTSVVSPLYINRYLLPPGPEVPWTGTSFTPDSCFDKPAVQTQQQNAFNSIFSLKNLLTTTTPGLGTYNKLPKGLSVGTYQFKTCIFENEILLKRTLVEHGPLYLSIPGEYLQSSDYNRQHNPANNWIILGQGPVYSVGNHAVVCIGYGERQLKPGDPRTLKKVWIFQNSWGTVWGDSGLFYLPRGISESNLGGWSIIEWKGWATNGPCNIFNQVKQSLNYFHFLYVKSECPSPNYSRESNCTACKEGYNIATLCATCTDSDDLDPNFNCDVCMSNAMKNPNPDPTSNPPTAACTTCLPYFSGPDCKSCTYGPYPSKGAFEYPYCVPQCADPFKDPNTGCKTCLDDLARLNGFTCTCVERAVLNSRNICECRAPYVENYDDPNFDVTCECKKGYAGDNCAQCATNYSRDAAGNCVANP